MGLRDLSEAIILQSAADLLGGPHEEDALDFFSGEGFRLCAELAKMDHDDKLALLEMLAQGVSACRRTKERSNSISNNKKPARRWADSRAARKGVVAARAAC